MRYCVYCMSPIEENDKECPFCGRNLSGEQPGHHLVAGTVLNKRYQVGAAIGEGGFGITYIGRDTTLDMKVAIKEYYPNGYVNRNNTISSKVVEATVGERKDIFDKGREKFLQEARILAKFSGELGIVDVRDFFEENNTVYIVMEYLEGQTLKEYLEANGTLSPRKAVELLQPIMYSLNLVHKQGLIHRDISPDNIMLVGNKVKLLDFGAARNVSGLTNRSISVMLKPGYAPEEQYRSKGVQGPWTDVYALCATLYKCITGVTPDDGTERLVCDELKVPSALGIKIDSDIEYALMKGLSVLQKDRYQSIEELLKGLQGINQKKNQDVATMYVPKAVEQEDVETRYLEGGVETEQKVQVKEKPSVDNAVNKEKKEENKKPAVVVNPKPSTSLTKKETPVKGDDAKKQRSGAGKIVGIIIVLLLIAIGVAVALVVSNKDSDETEDDKAKTTPTVTLTPTPTKTTDKDDESDSKLWIQIGDQRISKFEEDIELDNMTITAEIAEAFAQFAAVEYLTFESCEFEEGTFSQICGHANEVRNLVLSGCTGIESYSAISEMTSLARISIESCELTDGQVAEIDFSPLTNLYDLTLRKNKLESIPAIETDGYTFILDVSGNAITSLAGLNTISGLTKLYANDNRIVDISDIGSATNLTCVELKDNEITSLQPIKNLSALTDLYVDNNKLTSLEGLEECLYLDTISASFNQIESISGLTNCTILREVNLNDNYISDISLLGKSAATLSYLYLNNNNVSDISALNNTTNLMWLSISGNSIASLDALSDSMELSSICAENNQLGSIDGIANCTKLTQVYLRNNSISDMSPIKSILDNLDSTCFPGVYDLSGNQIKEVKLGTVTGITSLLLHGNPIEVFDDLKNAEGREITIDYSDAINFEELAGKYQKYYIIECPLDKRVAIETALGGAYYVKYVTASDVSSDSFKNNYITGYSDEEWQ